MRLHISLVIALTFGALLAIRSDASAMGPNIKLTGSQVLTGRFIHNHPVQGFDKPIRSEGLFTMDAKDQIVWAIEKPMATTTTITPSGLTQSVGQYTLLRLTPQQMPFLAHVQQSLLWALSGQWDRLKKDYTVIMKGNDVKWEVVITPKDDQKNATAASKPFRTITARGGQFVDNADVVLKNGTVDHVSFSDIRVQP